MLSQNNEEAVDRHQGVNSLPLQHVPDPTYEVRFTGLLLRASSQCYVVLLHAIGAACLYHPTVK